MTELNQNKNKNSNKIENNINNYLSEHLLKIYKELHKKYSIDEFNFNLMISNSLIENNPSHLHSIFKEMQLYENSTEYLRRFYESDESNIRLRNICDFYESYSKNFPNYTALPERNFIYKNIKKKQKIIEEKNKKIEHEISNGYKGINDVFFDKKVEKEMKKLDEFNIKENEDSLFQNNLSISIISKNKFPINNDLENGKVGESVIMNDNSGMIENSTMSIEKGILGVLDDSKIYPQELANLLQNDIKEKKNSEMNNNNNRLNKNGKNNNKKMKNNEILSPTRTSYNNKFHNNYKINNSNKKNLNNNNKSNEKKDKSRDNTKDKNIKKDDKKNNLNNNNNNTINNRKKTSNNNIKNENQIFSPQPSRRNANKNNNNNKKNTNFNTINQSRFNNKENNKENKEKTENKENKENKDNKFERKNNKMFKTLTINDTNKITDKKKDLNSNTTSKKNKLTKQNSNIVGMREKDKEKINSAFKTKHNFKRDRQSLLSDNIKGPLLSLGNNNKEEVSFTNINNKTINNNNINSTKKNSNNNINSKKNVLIKRNSFDKRRELFSPKHFKTKTDTSMSTKNFKLDNKLKIEGSNTPKKSSNNNLNNNNNSNKTNTPEKSTFTEHKDSTTIESKGFLTSTPSATNINIAKPLTIKVNRKIYITKKSSTDNIE